MLKLLFLLRKGFRPFQGNVYFGRNPFPVNNVCVVKDNMEHEYEEYEAYEGARGPQGSLLIFI